MAAASFASSSSMPFQCSVYSSCPRSPLVRRCGFIPSKLSLTTRARRMLSICTVLDHDHGLQLLTEPFLSYEELKSSTDECDHNFAYQRLESIISDVKSSKDARERIKKLLRYASLLPVFSPSLRIPDNRVMGCTAQVWLAAELGKQDGRLHFSVDSDSEITKGLCAMLVLSLDGALPEDVLAVPLDLLAGVSDGLPGGFSSRANSWHNLLLTMKKRTNMQLAKSKGQNIHGLFPSLLLSAEEISAQGSFALAQVQYLQPDQEKVRKLVEILKQKKVGVVAHFYMDPEVQGVLTSARSAWPHIHISDSLVMADRAVKMANAGCKYIAVLGVDFMSQNVRAVLDQAGYEKVSVYRMSGESISCSLAEAAENKQYLSFLENAAANAPALHVIYINTSLETKAQAHVIVPTITCTSSNVVQTVLQAFAQVSGISVWYGPDSYMGANLTKLFLQMANMTDEEISAIHPLHNKHSIISLLPRLHYYTDGACIVHHLFGEEVVSSVQKGYCDAFLTAHFEVPGEMFELAMEAKQRGMGVVGSTQNILDFITHHVKEAVDRDFDDKLQFVLGTEAGMITAIVGSVCHILRKAKSAQKSKVEVEIVFPVSSDAISTVPSSFGSEVLVQNKLSKLTVVPGVSSGEGCSLSGGCASCPYMKMNTLDALMRVCNLLESPAENMLDVQFSRRFNRLSIDGHSVAKLGCEPILHMRHFQSKGVLPQDLVDRILATGHSHCFQ